MWPSPEFVGMITDHVSDITDIFVGRCDAYTMADMPAKVLAWLSAHPIGGWVEIGTNANYVFYCWAQLS